MSWYTALFCVSMLLFVGALVVLDVAFDVALAVVFAVLPVLVALGMFVAAYTVPANIDETVPNVTIAAIVLRIMNRSL
ncbi:hypothetical protein [Alicyclobacillus mali (ex Roth et al. 2021)]|uniref:hypothetical protein n=1 Tax=Alicyclobacillus mali (ex Roth et al. 2021) TaxID=1123961 RepID=UPI001E2B7F0D|nr:hypothetical protein [Alicyclobacillus mali (ex Roth et al. 2021)]